MSTSTSSDYISSLNEPNIEDISHSALMSLFIIAKLHNIQINIQQIKHKFSSLSHDFNINSVLIAAKEIELKAKYVQASITRLSKIPLPAIGIDKQGIFFIIAKADDNDALIHYHNKAPKKISVNELEDLWTGNILVFTPSNFKEYIGKFDFTWFIPILIKYRKIFAEIFIISIALQIFALLNPLFFQVIMDKVLVHKGMSTLNVICIGLASMIIFEGILNVIRSYIFSHTATRIDTELGANLFKHLINLPLAYFEARRVGDSIARIRELESIRNFLTSNAITVFLDLICSITFMSLMFFYSVKLTLIVLCSLPIYILLSAIITPILKNRLEDKFKKSAENQAFLVETLTNIQTVKSSSLEPKWINIWNKQLSAYMSSGFATSRLGTNASQIVQIINKLVTLIIMYFGAKAVISQELSIGQLIAFNMIAGQVSQPIMRMSQLWTDLQQVRISMSRLADILNIPTESNQNNKVSLPNIKGDIKFDNVSFAYNDNASSKNIINNLNFRINAGEVIGIVGRSGSGKSTITKLIQLLYTPKSGKILIDNMDIKFIEPSSLRRQIGVVLQENALFNRSIAENIAITYPQASIQQITQAAILAGAHEFIVNLPDGYNTIIGEHGTGLSGGQRQRIAIARALISNPRILIFDEATSALDYESEHIIKKNMKYICKNRTVIVIAHRLSAVKDASRIMVMDNGELHESGNHEELIIKDGIYAYLHKLQAA